MTNNESRLHMKPAQHTTSNHSFRLALAAVLLSLMTALPIEMAMAATDSPANQRIVPDGIGPNYRNWRTEPDDFAGAPTNQFARARGNTKPSVVEIASGMNYWDGEKYSPSVASFDLTVDAFVANQVQHRKRLNADLNIVGAVTTTLRDGTTLRSTPVAIALYDPNDGRFAVVSTITNSVGVLVAANQVVYADAFSGGVCADVVYTLQQGSFEQDVIITGRLNPLDYGFPTNAQIQIVTEFYDPPAGKGASADLCREG